MLSGCPEVLEYCGSSGEEEERTFIGLSAQGPELLSLMKHLNVSSQGLPDPDHDATKV